MSQHVQLMTDYTSGKVLEYLSVIHPSAIHAQNRLDIARAQKQRNVQQAKETKGFSERNYINWNPEKNFICYNGVILTSTSLKHYDLALQQLSHLMNQIQKPS